MGERSGRYRASKRFPTVAAASTGAAVAVLVALMFQPVRAQLDGIEHWTADWRTVLLADRTRDVHDKIAVVLFNSETFGGATVSPIPRDLHADVIRVIDGMAPRAIGTDFYFVHSQGEEKDQAFLSAVRSTYAPVVLGAVDGRSGEFSPGQLTYQRTFLQEAGRPAGYLHLKYDSPGNVVRSMSPPLEGSPYTHSFAHVLATAAGIRTADVPKTGRIAWLAGPDSTVQPFLIIPVQNVLERDPEKRRALAEKIKGRIVITGIDMPNQDRHSTALSVRDGERMLGVMIHAHILAQILDGRHYREVRGMPRLALLGAVGFVGFALSWLFWQRRFDFLSLGVATAVLIGLDAMSYAEARTVLPFALALAVWFSAVTAGHNLRAVLTWARRRRARARYAITQ